MPEPAGQFNTGVTRLTLELDTDAAPLERRPGNPPAFPGLAMAASRTTNKPGC